MDAGPPPGPGWTLGEDGHWKPPPFEIGAPGQPPAPTGPPPQGPFPPPPFPPPPGSGPGSGARSGAVVAAIVGAVALFVVGTLVAAVTLLGTKQEERAATSTLPPSEIEPIPAPDHEDDDEDEPAPDEEPEVEITEAMLASQRVSEYVGNDEWRLAAGQPLPVESVEYCSPPGWNTGASTRFQTVYEHLTDGDQDGTATINLTVYDAPEQAAADKERAGSEAWYECQRQRVADQEGGTDLTIAAAPDDPLASGETYILSYAVDGQPILETFHYVFVGQIRATITFCGCTTVGFEGRQAVARTVAAALAEVQGLPTPGRSG